MVGNGGFEFEDPIRQNILPYFWRPGSGDGAGSTNSFTPPIAAWRVDATRNSYGGAGATGWPPPDSVPAQSGQLAHSGLRCVRIEGQNRSLCASKGWASWSPSLPTRSGDTYNVSSYVCGKDLKPAAGNPLAAFVEFSDATGRHRRRRALPAGPAADQPLTGTFEWTKLAAEVKAPTTAKRMRVFLEQYVGLMPSCSRASGCVLLEENSHPLGGGRGFHFGGELCPVERAGQRLVHGGTGGRSTRRRCRPVAPLNSTKAASGLPAPGFKSLPRT